jgi:hypothetical protein
MQSITELHQAACDQGSDTYIDPVSGYLVMTSKALLKQGGCCGNSCRHCPYGHINVPKQADGPQTRHRDNSYCDATKYSKT